MVVASLGTRNLCITDALILPRKISENQLLKQNVFVDFYIFIYIYIYIFFRLYSIV